MTMATSARARASGPVKVSARLLAARSQGDCAADQRGVRRISPATRAAREAALASH